MQFWRRIQQVRRQPKDPLNMCNNPEPESTKQEELFTIHTRREDAALETISEREQWDLVDLLAESVFALPAMIYWDPNLKLPSGSRLIFWNQMIHALRSSNFEEHLANQMAEQDGKQRGKPWPHKSAYVAVSREGLRRNVKLFKYRFSPYNKSLYILILITAAPVEGQRQGDVIGWFEAKGDSEVGDLVRQLQENYGL